MRIRSASSGQQVDTSALVQNFLSSLQGGRGQSTEKRFTTLPDLLPTSVTIPIIDKAPDSLLDSLLGSLPPTLLAIETEAELDDDADPTSDEVQAVIMSLSEEQKRTILRKVLRSPQLLQSLASLTSALRDGGLPTVGDALKVEVPNGGWVTRGSVPVTGEAAVRAFLEGIKTTAQKELSGEGRMDVD
jgi:26S proteasome regulatory subunit N13